MLHCPWFPVRGHAAVALGEAQPQRAAGVEAQMVAALRGHRGARGTRHLEGRKCLEDGGGWWWMVTEMVVEDGDGWWWR